MLKHRRGHLTTKKEAPLFCCLMCICVKEELKYCKGVTGRNSTCHRLLKTSLRSWCLDKVKEQTEQRWNSQFLQLQSYRWVDSIEQTKANWGGFKELKITHWPNFPIFEALTEAKLFHTHLQNSGNWASVPPGTATAAKPYSVAYEIFKIIPKDVEGISGDEMVNRNGKHLQRLVWCNFTDRKVTSGCSNLLP